jgi:hypothetical protein
MSSGLPASAAVRAVAGAAGDHEASKVVVIVAAVCGVWFSIVVLVQMIGFAQLYIWYSLKFFD